MRLIALLFLLLAFPAQAQIIRVIDGDTIRVQGQPVRIVGLDTPELRGACLFERQLAQQAKRRLEGIVARGVSIERAGGRDKYGRGLAIVRDLTSGRDVADILIREGLARPYNGRGRRAGWC